MSDTLKQNHVAFTHATFAPLVPACREHGISRTTAWILCKQGLLDTFNIGTRRFVYLESLRTLPQRLAERGGKK